MPDTLQRGRDGLESAGYFAVLNPGGRDKKRLFPNGAGSPSDDGHAPINYHAYAACCRGGFFQAWKEIPESVGTVLVLLRVNGLDAALKAVREAHKEGKKALISWKESGLHQVAESLGASWRYEKLKELCELADGYIASTPELEDLYKAAGAKAGEFVPTPYPVEEAAWNFSHAITERKGIFIGTREFDVPSRNHALAVSLAAKLGEPVTVLNADGGRGERYLKMISSDINVVTGPLDYVDYLRLMAKHRIVFQLDRSAVPGQVAGDALLCRMPCVGGDGAIERLAFADTCGFGRTARQVVEIAERLMKDERSYIGAMARTREAAVEKLSFSAGAETLQRICGVS